MRRSSVTMFTLGILLAFGPGCSLLIHGQETGRPCDGNKCPTGQICDNTTGTCKVSSLCQNDSDCADSTLRCDSSGACVDKCLGTVCATGQICQRGACGVPEAQDCSNAPCVPGLECVTLGAAKLCGQACTATADCYNPGDVCDTDSASATFGYCVFNWCSPDPGATVQHADYLGACNAITAGDGVCVGPVARVAPDGSLGLCEDSGSVAAGDTCTVAATYGDPGLCAGGRCVPAHLGDKQGTCETWCTLLDGQACAAVGGSRRACAWSGLGLAGSCAPQQAQPVAVGSGCSQSTLTLPCAQDAACVDIGDGKGEICHALCDLRTGLPCQQTCQKLKQGESLLGVCP